MADPGLDKLFSELEATFEASIAREEEAAASDLGFALAQTNRLHDVLPRLQQGVVLLTDGGAVPVAQVGADYLVTLPPVKLVPLARTVLRTSETAPVATAADSNFLLALRRIARARALVQIECSDGRLRSGLLLSAGEDFLAVREASNQVFVAMEIVLAIRPLCDPRSLGF